MTNDRAYELVKELQKWKSELLGRAVTSDECRARFPAVLDPAELRKVYAGLAWKHPTNGWIHRTENL